MARLIQADRKATVTRTHYNQGMQKSISEENTFHFEADGLQQMKNTSVPLLVTNKRSLAEMGSPKLEN